MVLLLLCPVGAEYARWRVILISLVLFLSSVGVEPVKTMTEEEYLEYDQLVQLPKPDSLKTIAPSVQVFSNDIAPSDVIKNDVDKSAEAINQHLTVNTSRIIFITHGFKGRIADAWMTEMKNEILDITSGNQQIVILVGWKKGASGGKAGLYWQAAANTQPVGEFIGDIVEEVKKGRPEVQIYGIGYSLGAHAMGNAGRYNGSFSRITGLDPAGPSFQDNNKEKRLSATDADFVDVIHTDGYQSSWSLYYGTLIPLGHLDFYPNWGQRFQPGCETLGKVKGCSHHKAVDYYIWSISNMCQFLCNSRIIYPPTKKKIVKTVDTITQIDEMPEMGYYADTRSNKNGYYYIATNADLPYVINANPFYLAFADPPFNTDCSHVSKALNVQWSPLVMLFLLMISRF